MKLGTKVRITNSNHADVPTGQEGFIYSVMGDRCGVAITKRWYFVNQEFPEDTRVVWFDAKVIQPI